MARPQLLQLLLVTFLAAATQAKNSKDQQPLVGGLQEVDVNAKDVQKMRDFALKVYNQESEDPYWSKAMRVLQTHKQLVAGNKYYLDIEVGRTTCLKSQRISYDCPLMEEPPKQKDLLCSFQILSVPWEGTVSMIEYSCEDFLLSA